VTEKSHFVEDEMLMIQFNGWGWANLAEKLSVDSCG
jgi:hypothetical protein